MFWFRNHHNLHQRIEDARHRLRRIAYSWTHDFALADDLSQETLLRAIERAPQLRDPDRFDAWLFQIMKNCWMDTLRSTKGAIDINDIEDTLTESRPGPDQIFATSQSVMSVRSAVACLPRGQREVLTLVDLEEFSYSQAAEILQIPIGTVMSRLCRARATLATMLIDSRDEISELRPRLRKVES
jgi:RNA polymerase sigma-70 factor (ECF subfamily)